MAATHFASMAALADNNPASGTWTLPTAPTGGWTDRYLGVYWLYSRNLVYEIGAPTGLTEKVNDGVASHGRFYVFYCWLQSGDTTTGFTRSVTSSNSTTIWGVDVLDMGASGSGDPGGSIGGITQHTNVLDVNPAAVAAAHVAGSIAWTLFGKNNDYTAVTVPTGYTLGSDASSILGTDGGAGSATKALPSAGGPEDPGAWTFTGGAATDDNLSYTWVLPAPAASGPVSGTSAVTVPAPSSTASAVEAFRGTSIATVLAPTSSASGAQEFTGTSVAAVVAPTSVASATQTFRGTAVGTIGAPTTTANGTYAPVAISGTAGTTVPAPTSGSAALLTFSATSAGEVPAPTSTASGTHALTITGTVGVSVPPPTSEVVTAQVFSATAVGSVPAPTSTASGTYTPLAISGTSEASVAAPTASAEGVQTFSGSVIASIPAPTSEATGSVAGAITGTIAVSVPAPSSAAEGTYTPLDITGTASDTVAAPTSQAEGSIGVPAITGTSASTTLAPTSAAEAIQAFVASGASTIDAPTSAATGTSDMVFAGIIAVLMAGPTSAASGTVGEAPDVILGSRSRIPSSTSRVDNYQERPAPRGTVDTYRRGGGPVGSIDNYNGRPSPRGRVDDFRR